MNKSTFACVKATRHMYESLRGGDTAAVMWDILPKDVKQRWVIAFMNALDVGNKELEK